MKRHRSKSKIVEARGKMVEYAMDMTQTEALIDAEAASLNELARKVRTFAVGDVLSELEYHDSEIEHWGKWLADEALDDETQELAAYSVNDHRRRRELCAAELSRRKHQDKLPSGGARTAITRQLIDDIKSRVDLADLMQSRGVELRQRGRKWKGRCPFHDDQTPSLSVDNDKGLWYCFGCNKGGDAINFLMESDKVDFIPALRDLSDRTGIELPHYSPTRSAPQTPNHEESNDPLPLSTLTADQILTTDWKEPIWAIPNLLPAGLCILAGKPKVGKSWLGLQIAFAIAAGGVALNERAEAGRVLYLALEDPPRRLKQRMSKQGWVNDLPADFLTIGEFEKQIHDLRDGGGERLARQIQTRGYRLVVIDTLSRAVAGDQNDVAQMTRGLMPLQEIAHAQNCAIVLIDHHRKTGSGTDYVDAISDILGSTAKGAMADTAWGLYREGGKAGGKLAIIGREVEERSLALKMDWMTGVWQCDGDADAIALTERRQEILDALRTMGRAKLKEIAEAIGQDRSNTYKRLQDLVGAGLAKVESGYYSTP